MSIYRIFLTATLALLSILFFFGGPEQHSPRSYKAVWNLGHILYFALLALLVFNHPRIQPASDKTKALLSIAMTLTIGTCVEFVQYGIDRSFEIQDIYRNLIGALVAIVFLLPAKKTFHKAALYALRSAVVIVVIVQLYPVAVALRDEHDARRDFPNLSDFESQVQLHRWGSSSTISIANNVGTTGNRALQVTLTTNQYSGVGLKYFPGNWMQYQGFEFRVFNPAYRQISITCRIHDSLHNNEYNDRFNKTYRIFHGWNTILIDLAEVRDAPKNRQMDLTKIRGINFFTTRLSYPRILYFDDLRLSRSLR